MTSQYLRVRASPCMFFPLAEQEVGSGGTYIVVDLRIEVRDITLLWPVEHRHRRVHTSGRIYMSHHARGDELKMTYLDSCYPLTIDHIDHHPPSNFHSSSSKLSKSHTPQLPPTSNKRPDSYYLKVPPHPTTRPSPARHSNNLPLPNTITHDHPPLESD